MVLPKHSYIITYRYYFEFPPCELTSINACTRNLFAHPVPLSLFLAPLKKGIIDQLAALKARVVSTVTRPERYGELHVKRIFVNAALGKSMARVEVVSNQPSVAAALRTVN